MKHWRSSHYAVSHVRNKHRNIQGRLPNVVKMITYMYQRELLLMKILSFKRTSHFEMRQLFLNQFLLALEG